MNFNFAINFFNSVLSLPKKIDIYTDGSHKGKWGSWAFVVVSNKKIIYEASGKENKTNSHRMEFQAAIEALTYLKVGTLACIHSDSRVLINFATQVNKRQNIHLDQTEKLNQLIALHNISWKWVKAHSGNIYNERCDQLCVQSRESI